jgi:hypothetical protein
MAELQKYPLWDSKKLADEGFGLVKDYVFYKAIDWLKPPEEERKTKAWKIIGEALDSTQEFQRQGYITKLNSVFPKLAIWNRYSEGASKIEKLYTVQIHGAELPVYITEKGDEKPKEDSIRENIKKARDVKESPYNDKGSMIRYYNDNFSNKAATKYSRGDFDKIEDQAEFRKWFVRDDTWLIQQYGDRLHEDEMDVDLDGISYHVKVYSKPSRLMNWFYWAAADKIYDFVDGPFDVIQDRIEAELGTDARQLLLKNEYKAITGLIRSLFSTRSPELNYDCTEPYVIADGAADGYDDDKKLSDGAADGHKEDEELKKAA